MTQKPEKIEVKGRGKIRDRKFSKRQRNKDEQEKRTLAGLASRHRSAAFKLEKGREFSINHGKVRPRGQIEQPRERPQHVRPGPRRHRARGDNNVQLPAREAVGPGSRGQRLESIRAGESTSQQQHSRAERSSRFSRTSSNRRPRGFGATSRTI